jgi:hypothetical protein
VNARFLFRAVVTPLGLLGRPVWRRRIAPHPDPQASTYWRRRRDEVTAESLKRRM